MTGIEKLRDVCKALKYSPYCGTDIATIGGEPAYEKLSKIADQIEREIDEAVADEVADTLDAYEMNTNARWHSAVAEGEESDCKAGYELISRYWLPRPRFEDGEPVQVGDKFVNKYGNVATADTVVVSNHGFTLYDRGSATHFKLTESVKRPEQPKVLDADGVEIKVGDEVWLSGSGCGPYRVSCVLENEMVTVELEHVRLTDLGIEFTHKRPEPPDTWERIAADVEDSAGSSCRYFKKEYNPENHTCYGCKAHESDGDCTMLVTLDVLGRAKKLAGVE